LLENLFKENKRLKK